MFDEYVKQTGDKSKAAFTGKSIGNGGSLGREAATGKGGVIALSELLRLEKDSDKAITFTIQGYGNVGSYFGVVSQKVLAHCKLVAVSDSENAIKNENGLDASKLQKFKGNRGRFKDYQEAQTELISNDDLLGLEVDVLILAGLENSVTKNNMKRIKAKYIVEMGNGPITNEAYEYLTKEGKVVLPDIIANAGGVLVSYFEWLQNKNEEHWSEEEVGKRLTEFMKRAVADMHVYSKKHNVSLKEAAFSMAVKRLAE
jgi:glutamate dehydrogenase/leucine dehydrogenase